VLRRKDSEALRIAFGGSRLLQEDGIGSPVRLRFDRRRFAWTGAFAAVVLGLFTLVSRLPFAFNFTESLPVGLYRLTPLAGRLAQGTTIEVCPPAAVAALGRSRAYLLPGEACPARTATILKIVAAVAGDTVDVRDDGILVDGRALANSAPRVRDSVGRPLPRLSRGRRILAPGQIWLWTPNPVSFDSRYYGSVPARSAVVRARLVWQTAPWPYAAALPTAAP